tara:strand:- start:295 stop:639 length:345 start_codon:yes stop_codon:yes gene_type:complete
MAQQTITNQILSNLHDVMLDTIEPGSTTLIDEAAKEFTGPFYAVTALADTIIDVDQCKTGIKQKAAGAALEDLTTANITVTQGMTIYSHFESIELVSGSLLAYARKGVTVTVEA